MVFVDNLAYSLFALSFAGFMLLYTIASMYLVYMRKKKSFSEHMEAASVPLMLIGLFLLVQGLWGQFAWPLPGSYNILFYDPMVSFGILLLAFSLAVRFHEKIEYVGFLGLMVGIIVLIYGAEGYSLRLTAAPTALLGLYFLYGVAGIFSYPVALIADRSPGLKKNAWKGWHLVLIIFCILLFLASALSAYVGVTAITSHLVTAP